MVFLILLEVIRTSETMTIGSPLRTADCGLRIVRLEAEGTPTPPPPMDGGEIISRPSWEPT